MPKFYGVVGYAVTEEVKDKPEYGPHVHENKIKEVKYYGDVLQNYTKWERGEQLNDDLNVSNRISIVADAYAYEHFSAIKYVAWMGAKWKVNNIELQRPRIILSIGGVWNG